MNCVKPMRITKNLNPSEYPDGLSVPCGQCLNCRIQKRREWTMRMIHELDSWDKAVFLTLTYSDEYLPDNMSLKKSDLQKYIKRLRKALNGRKIKYFACGEYGNPPKTLPNGSITQGFRPHYHAIIFGISPAEHEFLQRKWPFGNTDVGLVEPDSIRYVAQYIDSKLSGEEAVKEYDEKNREPVFRVLSQGIGKEFVKKNAKQLIDNEQITLFGVNMSFPRYYLKLLGLENSNYRKQNAILKDMDQVQLYTDIPACTFDDFYKSQPPEEVKRLNDILKGRRQQKEKNLQAKMDMSKRKL